MSVSFATQEATPVFNFNPADYANQYACNGYVRIPGGMNPDFLEFIQATTRRLMDQDKSLRDWEFKGKKRQYLFDFPDTCDFPRGVKEAVAAVTGLDADKLTLCERHIKVYDAEADPNPAPHKDRLASEVAVGIPLTMPMDSVMVVYPHQHAGVNAYHTTAALRDSLDEDELPENLLASEEPVEIDLQLGDIVMFRGSALYHERLNAANTIMLYLKFNAMRLDPLGEDPWTGLQYEASQRALSTSSDAALLDSVIEVSPRLESVNRLYTRLYWKGVLQARMNGEKPFTITEDDFQVLRNTDGAKTAGAVLETTGVPAARSAEMLVRIRRLISKGALDIVRQ